MKRVALLSAALLLSVTASFGSGVLVEAESFGDKGGWAVDQQFMDQMGSPYLIAHGMGKPVADAVTTVEFPETGTYQVYVRTFNWVAPWYDGEGPGKFTLRVGGRKLPATLGCTGSEWMWQCAGKVSVRKGPVSVSLTDLSGFDGRCDAIYFTTEEGDVPPSGAAELAAFRKQMLGIPATPQAAESFDFVVVGGGIAGMCAAAAAARLGCSVALVNDRPVLGGNNSSEIRVHLGGVIELGPNEGLGRMIREFGHSREGNARPAENYEDAKKSAFIAGEENVKLFSSCHAVAVNKEGGRIKSVIVRHIETGEETTLEAPLFADCTGDGTVGFLAGADYRMGRESRDEFGETLAPETADRMTMGSSVQWYSVDTGRKTAFPTFSYGVEFNAENCERVTMGEWKWETGMNLDQIRDFERIRDYGLLVIYSNWSFLKNGLKDNAKYRNRELGWVAYVAGKRESRRLLGDLRPQTGRYRQERLPRRRLVHRDVGHRPAFPRFAQLRALPGPGVQGRDQAHPHLSLCRALPVSLLPQRRQPVHGRTEHQRDARGAGHGARDADHRHDGRGGRHGGLAVPQIRRYAPPDLPEAPRRTPRADARRHRQKRGASRQPEIQPGSFAESPARTAQRLKPRI